MQFNVVRKNFDLHIQILQDCYQEDFIDYYLFIVINKNYVYKIPQYMGHTKLLTVISSTATTATAATTTTTYYNTKGSPSLKIEL